MNLGSGKLSAARELYRAIQGNALRGQVSYSCCRRQNMHTCPRTFLQMPQLNSATFLQRLLEVPIAEEISKSAGARCRRRREAPAIPDALARAVEVMLMEEDRGRAGAGQCLHGLDVRDVEDGGHGRGGHGHNVRVNDWCKSIEDDAARSRRASK